jgi:uncharacterized DUF497 family protein
MYTLKYMYKYIDKYGYACYSIRIMTKVSFEWDANKELLNQKKHGVGFIEAQQAFLDPERVIAEDCTHSTVGEKRYYCFGNVLGEVMTVRFTYRGEVIRIIGAGFWRKGKAIYEKQNG